MYSIVKNTIVTIIFLLYANIGYTQIRVACVGNSITLGSGSTNPYPAQLSILLGQDYDVDNLGHAGTSVLKNALDTYWDEVEFELAWRQRKDIFVILFGTNATFNYNWSQYSHEFIGDYIELINKFKTWDSDDHNSLFILGLPPPIFSSSSRNDILINEVIPKIKSVASQTGATIADLNNPMKGHPEWFDSDGVHPNALGDSVIASIINELIHKSLDPAPKTPSGLKTISGVNSIKLIWDANTEPDMYRYRIYRTESPTLAPQYFTYVSHPITSFTDLTVKQNTVYYYALKAIDRTGNSSGRSPRVAGQTTDNIPPDPPQMLQIIQDADTVKLSWQPNTETDLSRYYIYRNNDYSALQEASSIIGFIESPATRFNDTTYGEAVNYYYGVKAQDYSGNTGQISNIVNITTKSRPVSADTTIISYEDIPYTFAADDFPYFDADSDTLDDIILTDSEYPEYFLYDGNSIEDHLIIEDISKLIFTPPENEFGDDYASFSFRIIDSFGSTSIDTSILTINVSSVNDAPQVDPVEEIFILEESPPILIKLSGINSGYVEELDDLSIKAFSSDINSITITDIQYTSPEDTATVIITPLENVFGIHPITVKITDSGGTENGGVDTTLVIFNVNITPINDPPILTIPGRIQLNEDTETSVILTDIKPGPFESDQKIEISVKSDNTSILPHPELVYTYPDETATLNIKTLENIFGETVITLTAKDDGGRELGGMDSTSYFIPVEITAVNDLPSDFSIQTPDVDTSLVIDKRNLNSIFQISWEPSFDIESDNVYYNLIFDGDLSKLSRKNITSTQIEFSYKDILSVTDTISIAVDSIKIFASDGQAETPALNNAISIKIDGRTFALANLNLDQNQPNPFNNETLIGFDLPSTQPVTLVIYDILGNEVVKLIDNKKYPRGYNTIKWNGLDNQNELVSAGIYIMHLKASRESQHKKLIYLK